MSDLDISVVIPCRDEALNLPLLLDEIEQALAGRRFEVVVVNDASVDDTAEVLAREAAARAFPLRQIRHDRPGGQSIALRSGAFAARGEIVATVDGDGQNDPQFIPVLVDALVGGGEAVGIAAGQRVKRKDTVMKQYASRFANGLRRAILKDDTRDPTFSK